MHDDTLQVVQAEKEQLIARLASSRRAALDALQGVNPLQVVYPEQGWRVKDVLGHLAAWEREALASLQAYVEGDEQWLGPAHDGARYNKEVFTKRYDYDAAQCRIDWAMVRRELQFAVEAVPPEKWAGPLRFPWGEQGSVRRLIEDMIAHEAEHLADIPTAGERG